MLKEMGEYWVKKFFHFTGFNLLLAFLCCISLLLMSPAASGSGMSDVKAYLNGVEHPIFKNFFTVKTFVAKVHSSCTAPTHCTACLRLEMLFMPIIADLVMARRLSETRRRAVHERTGGYRRSALSPACAARRQLIAAVKAAMAACIRFLRDSRRQMWTA